MFAARADYVCQYYNVCICSSYLSELQLPIIGKQLAPIFPGSAIDQALERP